MVDVEGWMQCSDDVALHVSRCRVLAPGDVQVVAHPLGQPSLVLVDQDDAVGPAGPVVLLIEQEAGQGAAQG